MIIVGAGLAGAASAYHLRAAGRDVCVLHDNDLRRSASQIGGGLVNPMMARKGRPAWMAAESLAALESMGINTNQPLPGRDAPLYRPAGDITQADSFREQAAAHPELGRFRETVDSLDFVHAPFGILEVRRGAALDLQETASAWLHEIGVHAIDPAWKVEESRDAVSLSTSGGTFRGKRLLLCMGAGMLAHPLTRTLNLHGIKGQIIRLEKPTALPDHLPPLSGKAYLVDAGDGSVWVGSTFERNWESMDPTDAGRDALLHRAASVIPMLKNARVLEQRTAQRVTVPGTRLPMVGPLHPDSKIWVMTGLGSKGMLYSALFGSRIPVFFNNPEAIPAFCRVVHRSAES